VAKSIDSAAGEKSLGNMIGALALCSSSLFWNLGGSKEEAKAKFYAFSVAVASDIDRLFAANQIEETRH
jgi:hypothetical protein